MKWRVYRQWPSVVQSRLARQEVSVKPAGEVLNLRGNPRVQSTSPAGLTERFSPLRILGANLALARPLLCD